MAVLTSETCWAVNNEIIKQVTSSWSLSIQNVLPKIILNITLDMNNLQHTLSVKTGHSEENRKRKGNATGRICSNSVSIKPATFCSISESWPHFSLGGVYWKRQSMKREHCSHPTTQRPTTATNHIQQSQRSTPHAVTYVLFSWRWA